MVWAARPTPRGGARRHDGGMSTTSGYAYGPPPPGGFYAYRPIVVPADLDSLRGPLEGVVRIPSHIDTSARAWYDLADEGDREMLYRIVILEAWKDEDFAVWLNRDALVELWPCIHLPRPVRAKWEAHHPVLAARGAGPGVPRP
jgi:hypothetical protein